MNLNQPLERSRSDLERNQLRMLESHHPIMEESHRP
jgi:hypothetical protein